MATSAQITRFLQRSQHLFTTCLYEERAKRTLEMPEIVSDRELLDPADYMRDSQGNVTVDQFTVVLRQTAVPEPTSLALFALTAGGGMLLSLRLRRKREAEA